MACKKNYKTGRLQFVVGGSIKTSLPDGSYTVPEEGQTQVSFNLAVVDDSVECWLDGPILPREDLDQISYSIIYDTAQTVVTLFNGVGIGVSNGQEYIIRLNWLENIS